MADHAVVYHDPEFWAATPANRLQTHIAATIFSPPDR